ncbi:MAG: group 1 truncated hemoglobin [Verrucomicrobiota bacterium JB023]|nr:group 1 truncated hemoglobin [Verrucomicrobiota bacterium JB023]
MENESLYERIGGEEGISKLIDQFYERVLADEELAPFFQHTPIEKLQRMQKEFFSEALGGPLFYSGKPLRQVHAGKGIRKEHLRRFTDHLKGTLESEQAGLNLSAEDIHAIHSRIALEADEIAGQPGEAG